MEQRDHYSANLSGFIDDPFDFTGDAFHDIGGLPNLHSEGLERQYEPHSTGDSYVNAGLDNDSSMDPAMQAFEAHSIFPQPDLNGQLPYDNHLEQGHVAGNYDGIGSHEVYPEWHEDSNAHHGLKMQNPVDDSPVQYSSPKSNSRLNKNFKPVQYDDECLALHKDILGHGPISDKYWHVSVRRGERHWGKMNAMYSRDEKKCTTSVNDATFPVNEAQQDHYAQKLFDALVDWTDYKEKKAGVEDLDEAQLAILGQTLTPYKTECLAQLLFNAAVKSQQGELLFAPWSTTNDYWESFETFADRVEHMCQSLRASKQLVKSLIADGQTWANRIASRPKKEIKSKEGNKKLNDGKKDKMKKLEKCAKV